MDLSCLSIEHHNEYLAINGGQLPNLTITDDELSLVNELDRVVKGGQIEETEINSEGTEHSGKVKKPKHRRDRLSRLRKPMRKQKLATVQEQLRNRLNQEGIEREVANGILNVITKLQRLTKIRQAVVDSHLQIDPFYNVLPELCIIQKSIYDTNRYIQYYLQICGQDVPAFLLELGDFRLPELCINDTIQQIIGRKENIEDTKDKPTENLTEKQTESSETNSTEEDQAGTSNASLNALSHSAKCNAKR